MNATQRNVTGAENWVAVKGGAADVIVEARTAPNNTLEEWEQIVWSGDTGEPVPGQPNHRRLSRAVSRKFQIEASLGGVDHHVKVWIIWAQLKFLTQGARPPNAAPFDSSTEADVDQLGAVTYESLTSSVIDEATGALVRNMSAAGKVVPVATLSPKGIHAVVHAGWGFERTVRAHEWMDSSQRRMDTAWIRDTSKSAYLRLTPDLDDRIYDLDAPNIRWGQWSFETYNNFQQWIEWNNQKCSDPAFWHWQARWRLHADPKQQIILNDLGTGNITLPSRQFFTVLSRFELNGTRTIPGGESTEATVTLHQKAPPDGVVVTVTSDHPEEVSSQSSVGLSAGQDRVTFAIATRPIDSDLNFRLAATVFGPRDMKHAGGTLKAAQISKLLIPKRTPAKKKGTTATIVLTGRAGPHTQIKLNNPLPPIEAQPGTVDVPSGATQVEFKYDTGDVSGDTSGSIVATLNGSVATAWTTVEK
ncbi:hypothetical protein [Corallococcus exiguus]|uniref:hypothetical protein n=1 Tax=Corallococcus exiguus TaxID=83462 RepID=UPI00149461CC|nr:hypothetical protein [Corallococcus exiguus]NPD21911.1 hypothetical protein [Corallococcus exiguus]NRD47293.1 hypothetical protein [Corallococcus exiguus]